MPTTPKTRPPMSQVSTNLTLFYRLFIPIFSLVFLGALLIFLWLHPQAYYGNLRGDYLRYGATAVFAMLVLLLALTVWRLRRVEMNREWVYVTDFFRQARYPWAGVAGVRETPLGIFSVVHVDLAQAGTFGKSVTFLASVSRWRMFKEEHPDQLADRLR